MLILKVYVYIDYFISSKIHHSYNKMFYFLKNNHEGVKNNHELFSSYRLKYDGNLTSSNWPTVEKLQTRLEVV